MKIKLSVSGGFIPLIKEAEIDENLSAKDWKELISAIETKPNARARDAKHFTLEAKGKSILIDPSRIPEKYKSLFEKLTESLKPLDMKK